MLKPLQIVDHKFFEGHAGTFPQSVYVLIYVYTRRHRIIIFSNTNTSTQASMKTNTLTKEPSDQGTLIIFQILNNIFPYLCGKCVVFDGHIYAM